MTPNKGSGPKFAEIVYTVYISEINGAKRLTSEAQIAMKRAGVQTAFSLRPHAEFFSLGVSERTTPTEFFSNFWNCSKRVELGSSYSGCRLI